MEIWTRYSKSLCSSPSIQEDEPHTMEACKNFWLAGGFSAWFGCFLACYSLFPMRLFSSALGAVVRLGSNIRIPRGSLSHHSKPAHCGPPQPPVGKALPHSPGQLLVIMEHGDLSAAKAWALAASRMPKLPWIPQAVSALGLGRSHTPDRQALAIGWRCS